MWFWYALSASVLWGVVYVANQYLLRYFSWFEILFLHGIIMVVSVLPVFYFQYKITNMFVKLINPKVSLVLVGGCLIYIVSAILNFKSISLSNASHTAVVESSYPIFTMIFAYLILGEIQFTLSTLIGATFIVTGLIIIKA